MKRGERRSARSRGLWDVGVARRTTGAPGRDWRVVDKVLGFYAPSRAMEGTRLSGPVFSSRQGPRGPPPGTTSQLVPPCTRSSFDDAAHSNRGQRGIELRLSGLCSVSYALCLVSDACMFCIRPQGSMHAGNLPLTRVGGLMPRDPLSRLRQQRQHPAEVWQCRGLSLARFHHKQRCFENVRVGKDWAVSPDLQTSCALHVRAGESRCAGHSSGSPGMSFPPNKLGGCHPQQQPATSVRKE